MKDKKKLEKKCVCNINHYSMQTLVYLNSIVGTDRRK